jgi:hypothetical protein
MRLYLINKNNKRNNNNHFIEGNYSGEYNIEYDTIHLDKPPPPPQKRDIEYYFLDHWALDQEKISI